MSALPTRLSEGGQLSVLFHRVVPTWWLREQSCVTHNRAGMGSGAGWALILTIQDPVHECYLSPFLEVCAFTWMFTNSTGFKKDIITFARYLCIPGVMMDRTYEC